MCKCSITSSIGFLAVLVIVGFGILSAPGVSRADVLTPWKDPVFDGDLENAWHVAISPTSPYAYVFVTSQWRGGALVALKRDAKGALVHKNVLRHSPDVVDGLREPNGVAISKDSKFLYVASAGDSTVSVFAWNSASEKLAPITGQVWKGNVPEWNVRGCFGVTLSSDQKNLYVTGHDNGTLWIFAVQSDGKLIPKKVLRDGAGGLSGFRGPMCVAVTPDKDQVFVTAESSNTLFIFNRDLNTGDLTLNKAWPNGKDSLTGLAVVDRLCLPEPHDPRLERLHRLPWLRHCRPGTCQQDEAMDGRGGAQGQPK
jgi:DNA-binding beta-propeller fold protein YncE